MSATQECRRCCVLGCPNGKTPAKISMHRIPDVDPTGSEPCDSSEKKLRNELRSRWLRLAGVPEDVITPETSFVCARHFPPNAYQHIDTDQKKMRRLKAHAVPLMFLPGQKIESEEKKTSVEIPSLAFRATLDEKSADEELSKNRQSREDEDRSPSAEENCQVVDDGAAEDYVENETSFDTTVLSTANSNHEPEKHLNKKDSGNFASSLPPVVSKGDAIEPVETIESEDSASKTGDNTNIGAEVLDDSSEPVLFVHVPDDSTTLAATTAKSRSVDGIGTISNGHLNLEAEVVMDEPKNTSATTENRRKNGVIAFTEEIDKDAEIETTIQFALINDDIEMEDEVIQDDTAGTKIGQTTDEAVKEISRPNTSTGVRFSLRNKLGQCIVEETETDSQDSTRREVAAIFGQDGSETGPAKQNSRKPAKVKPVNDERAEIQHEKEISISSPASQKSTESLAGSSESATDSERRTLRSSLLKRASEGLLEKPGPSKKMALDEIKTQARMKYSPRKVDLAKGDSASPSASPPVLMGRRNLQMLLNNYGELIAQDISQKLGNLAKAQTVIFHKMFEKIAAHALLMEQLHRDVSCRLNSCKYANSVRHAAIQVASVQPCVPAAPHVASNAPQTTQMAPPQQQSLAAPGPSAALARQQQQQSQQVQQSPPGLTGAGVVRQVVPQSLPIVGRGRPRLPQPGARQSTPMLNAALQARSPSTAAPVKPQIDSNAVIDLTDDEPVRVEPASSPVRSSTLLATRTPQVAGVVRRPTPATAAAIPVGGIVPASALRAVVPNSIQQLPRGPVTPVRAATVVGSTAQARLRVAAPVARVPTAVMRPRGTMIAATQVVQRVLPPSTQVATTVSVSHGGQTITSPRQSQQHATTGTLVTGSGTTPTVHLPPDIVMRPIQTQQAQQPVHQTSESSSNVQGRRSTQLRLKHPAPLPPTPTYTDQGTLSTPPAPIIQQIKRTQKGIVVTFDAKKQPGVRYADTEKYQVYSYVETNDPPSTSTWNKVGEVGSLRLPMACTFTQFKDGHRIFFAVRGVDATGRLGSFNEPKAIDLRENVIIL